MSRLPNLFRGPQKSSSAERLYEVFLSRLHISRNSDRMLSACREIRRYAKLTGNPHIAVFTYFWEMKAHSQNQNYEAMWRSLRAEERCKKGRQLRLSVHRWSAKDRDALLYHYAPLLYLTGRYRLGCRVMETALKMASHRLGWSFESLWHVYTPGKSPASIYNVSLARFYAVLGKNLADWELWDRFLDGFHPRLFRSSGISKEDLRHRPDLIRPFSEWIIAERRKRVFSGMTDGERYLVESPSKVRRRQSARKKLLLRFDRSPRRDLFEQRLRTLFPELNELPQPTSFEQLLKIRKRK